MAERLEDLQRRFARLGREGFFSRHPHPFLVRLDERGGRDEPVPWAFPGLAPGPKGTTSARLTPPAGPMASVHELIKQSGKGSRDTLHLGRTDDNDLVIKEMSISRHHASFITPGPGLWHLADAGGRNGTRLNGVKLAKGQSQSVTSGDLIMLGDVVLLLLFSEELVAQLPSLMGD